MRIYEILDILEICIRSGWGLAGVIDRCVILCSWANLRSCVEICAPSLLVRIVLLSGFVAAKIEITLCSLFHPAVLVYLPATCGMLLARSSIEAIFGPLLH